MNVRGWRRSWQERSKLERIDLYSRVTISSIPWLFSLSWQLAPFKSDIRHEPLPLVLGSALLVVSLVQCLLSNRNVESSYAHYLGISVFPGRRMLAPLALLMLQVGLLATLAAVDGVAGAGLLLMGLNTPMALVITRVLLVPVRTFVIESLLLAALTTGALAAAGVRGGTLAGVVPATLFGCVLVLISVRPSAWSLSVMWQAEEARDVQARLAVAEERLRFGRDLHDVMGRNLAVIALKSELAVELAQRGRPEALDQMVEVQRIARASQQEVRDVVRGYRKADLATELAGAQGVLRAAGIECTVTGSDGTGLPGPVQSALGWVVREAATNVLRHGDPGRCTIRLGISADAVVLDVENDGAPAAAPEGTGSGLAGLRERLGELDGALEAGPAADSLFRLSARIPLARAKSADVPYAAAGDRSRTALLEE
ncbi:sensor histidine kinase [Streptomyces poriferorum]|uniref:Histidine kinase n=1 Tax=Streptomyces poriferorum TaxID=2798799 RepID=A0ABY9IU44_9ACTN|nr:MULTISPECIES: histidine kinase [unclassified Streptomyces]MDP5313454.1 histidine kinase [Streptomyces sp. Alt4]WLQ57568.1 histidine kinase [Streptomyces sp. Alt2]